MNTQDIGTATRLCWPLTKLCSTFVATTILLLGVESRSPAQVLYDAALGTLPAAQSWSYVAIPGTAVQSLTGGAVRLDTSVLTGEQAGYLRAAPVSLDRTRGFTLAFSTQLHAETHNTTNRAGFSVIVLGQDKKGIELGFWTNRVFAQSDSPLFIHAEEASFNTAAGLVDYALTIGPTNYTLRAQGTNILTGRVRDYTAFVGTFDPYETPNFLFFGDDTTSASAAVSLRKIMLIPPPTLTAQQSGVMCWSGVSNQTYSVEQSLDLKTWHLAGTSTSATGSFCYTNTTLATNVFFRVVWP